MHASIVLRTKITITCFPHKVFPGGPQLSRRLWFLRAHRSRFNPCRTMPGTQVRTMWRWWLSSPPFCTGLVFSGQLSRRGRVGLEGEGELVFGAPRVAVVARARARNYGSRKRAEVSQWWVAVVESRPFQTLVDIASTQG